MGNAFLALEQNPDQRRSLRARADLCGPAAEELLRFEPPVYFTGERVAAADVDLGALKIAEGESVVCVLASANRDPAWIDRPNELDFTRQGVRRSMAFGTGLHTCIGQHLARLEMRTLLQVLYAESPEFSIDTSAVRHRPNIIYRGLTKAPAAFA
jgi:cytochrome P450